MSVEKSPYEELIRLLRQRIRRQKDALVDSESQLAGAEEAHASWAAKQNVLPLERAKK